MPAAGMTGKADIKVNPREIDFVTRFARNWKHLMEILGIMRPVRKTPGVMLKSKYAQIALESGDVGEGETIPASKASVKTKDYEEMDIEKYKKSVSIEAIKEHGYEVAVGMTDDEFLAELQNKVTSRFYSYLKTGTLTGLETTFQMALAMAQGMVVDKFKKMHRTVTEVVGFVNTLDMYRYLGAAEITIQNQNGIQYIKDFLGYKTVVLTSEIDPGKVIALPVENIVLYYISPEDSDFAKAGLEFVTDGETSLIGFHTEGDYDTAVSNAYAIMGMKLFAEYLDGIAVISIGSTSSPEITETE